MFNWITLSATSALFRSEFEVEIILFLSAGLCCMTACSIYAHRITTEFFDPLFVAQK